jgi:DUF1365 family protein
MYLDLAELDRAFAGRWLWSAGRPAFAWLRRSDHLGDPNVPLDRAVRDLVASRGQARPRGPIRLLTHLRYGGFMMNPLSLYYCYDERGQQVETVVAEVNNTPWGEQHCYVLSASDFAPGSLRGGGLQKEFHVSPFMSMNSQYHWSISPPADDLRVRISSTEEGRKFFSVGLHLERRPLTTANLARALVRFPLMTAQVYAGIYWQALRLWWKGCRFHPHPSSRRDRALAARPASPIVP